MEIIKYFMLGLVLIISIIIGKFLSQKYSLRLEELEKIYNLLNILKTKLKFTYEPLPEIFEEIAENEKNNIGEIFKKAKEKMEENTASQAWEITINETEKENKTNLSKSDMQILKSLSKLLGQTDLEGQISQIEITQNFLQTQIKEAVNEKQKNEKLYSRLGTTIGLAIIIILF